MAVSVGFTVEEIREFVLEYQALPQGSKGAWLSARSVSYWQLRPWRSPAYQWVRVPARMSPDLPISLALQ